MGTSAANNKLQTPALAQCASLSRVPEMFRHAPDGTCFCEVPVLQIQHLARPSVDAPFSGRYTVHQQKCHDSRGSVDAEGRQICIWNGRMQMIASGSPDRTAKGEQKEGLLGEGCWTARQASWVFTLQTASSQRGESARKKKKRERDMGWKRVRQRALFWIVFSQLVLTKHPLFAKLSLCFTWQWQRLYFPPVCCLRACGSLSPLVGLNTSITGVSGALWNGGGDTAVQHNLTLSMMAVLASGASRKFVMVALSNPQTLMYFVRLIKLCLWFVWNHLI